MAQKNYLIVVDMQRDFIDQALGTQEAVEIVPAVVEKIRLRKQEGWNVIATMDTHGEDYLTTHEGKKLPVPHCLKGSEGWRLHPDVEAVLGDSRRIEKPAFGSTALMELLRQEIGEENQVCFELIGLCTDICVVSNALLLRAYFPEAEIQVDARCCAGVTPDKHRAALETMSSCQIMVV